MILQDDKVICVDCEHSKIRYDTPTRGMMLLCLKSRKLFVSDSPNQFEYCENVNRTGDCKMFEFRQLSPPKKSIWEKLFG